MSAPPTSSDGPRRSGRHIPARNPAPEVPALLPVVSKRARATRSPTKPMPEPKPEPTPRKGKASNTSLDNQANTAAQMPPATSSTDRVRNSSAILMTSAAAVDTASAGLEEQQVRRSNAYGSRGQAAAPQRLVTGTANGTVSDALKEALEVSMRRTDATAIVARQPSAPLKLSPVRQPIATRQNSLNRVEEESESSSSGTKSRSLVDARRRRGGGSHTSSSSRVSIASDSSARSSESVGSANFLSDAFASTGHSLRHSSASPSIGSSAVYGSDSSAARVPVKAEPDAGISADAIETAARFGIPSIVTSTFASFGSWFAPIVWLLAIFDQVVSLASMAGDFLRHTSRRLLRLLRAIVPLLILVTMVAVPWMATNPPFTGVSLSPPFTVPSLPTWSSLSGLQPARNTNVAVLPFDNPSLRIDEVIPRLGKVESIVNGIIAHSLYQQELRKVNFLAPASGVAIDPYLTSPSRPLSMTGEPLPVPRRSWLARLFRLPISRFPKYGPGPASCLHKWDDAGECWCGPERHGKAQIGIVLAQPVIPTEIVVEHIEESRILEASATPKDLEMWIKIEDDTLRAGIESAALDSVNLNPSAAPPSDVSDDVGAIRILDRTWVRVGRWQYQRGGPASQTFTIPVNLQHHGIDVSNMVVRTLSSWGDANDSVCIYRLKLHGLSAEGLASAAER